MGDTRIRPPIEAFNMRYLPEPNSGCWLWDGAVNKAGYGIFSSKWTGEKIVKMAHRVSWELHCDEIPEGMVICHKCDVTGCVNPSHLFIGTQKDNMMDASRKKRFKDRAGEANVRAKLNEQDVLQIRQDLSTGETHPSIAKRYNVTTGTIAHIYHGRTWKMVS